MPGLLPDIDPDGLLEYSVVFTDRSLNHMSQIFKSVSWLSISFIRRKRGGKGRQPMVENKGVI